MNYLVPAGHGSLIEQGTIQARRDIPQSTAFEGIVASLYRQRLFIAGIFLACILVGVILTVYAPRQYKAVASVQLEQQVPRVIADPDLDPQPSAQESERFLQTQLDRIRSRALAEAVAARLKLDQSSEALAALSVDPAPRATVGVRAISKLQANMTAELGLNTRLAQIGFTSGDPEVSARIANAFATVLTTANVDSKLQTSLRAKEFLLAQLADAKGRLENSERRMLAYARRADLTTTVVPSQGEDDRGGSLRAQQLGLLTDSLAQATTRRIDAQQNWLQVNGTAPMAIPDVQSNRAIQDLVSQRAQLEAALREERQRHTDEYPSVRETAAKIEELNSQISTLASNVQSSFYGRYAAAAQQERQIAAVAGQLRGAAMAERERSVGYNSLKREVETSKAFYDGLLQRYKEVALALGAPSGNVTLVDRAVPPQEPSSPDVRRNMALASVSGLILALMFASIREGMHTVVRSSRDLEEGFDLPALGVVPRISGWGRQAALLSPTSAQMEAYFSAAVALEQALANVSPKTVLITSSVANEGKSTTAVGLARSFSAMGKHVLLVDADLRRPSSTKADGYDAGPGLSNALVGTALAETIMRDEEHGYYVMRAGDANSSPIALLAADHIRAMLQQLSAEYDIVIIDGPPIMGLADSVLLARSVSAVVMVIESNRVHSSELDLAVSRLLEANVVGGIITKFDARTAGVRYGGTDYYRY